MASVRGVQGGEVENLEPWIDPIIPGPAIYTVPPQYEDGLDQIDKLGAWDCALSSFNPMDGVPHLHRGKWVWAMSEVLSGIKLTHFYLMTPLYCLQKIGRHFAPVRPTESFLYFIERS